MKHSVCRTAEMTERYNSYIEGQSEEEKKNETLLVAPQDMVAEYTLWVIKKNKFPYDGILDTHDMLVPKRVFGTYAEATPEEKAEFEEIRSSLAHTYDAMLTNFPQNRSIMGHYHVHLISWKGIEE